MKRNHFYFFWRAVVTPIFFLMYRTKYIGAENVPKEGAYILASNHRRATDPILMGIGLKRQVLFMAKEELFKNKFISWFIRKLGAFPVSRGKADTGAIRHFENAVSNGCLMGNHGAVTWGRDLTEAWYRLEAVEHYAMITIYTTRFLGRANVLSERQIDDLLGKPLSLEDMGFEKGGAREFRNASRIIMDHIKALREQDLNE